MKKAYKKPETTLVEVEIQNLMALSSHETDEVLSRENNFDDSDWEDE